MKKGIVPIWISLFFAFLTIALLLLFYFVFLRGSREPQQIAIEESFTTVSHNVLVNYLNTPVTVQGETLSMTDLIRLARTKQDYLPELKAQTKKFLNQASFKYIELSQYVRGEQYNRTLYYTLVIYTKPPGRSGDDWFCADMTEQLGWSTCGKHHAESSAIGIGWISWPRKATALVQISEQETVYVALLSYDPISQHAGTGT
jgi:hypothetical protein